MGEISDVFCLANRASCPSFRIVLRRKEDCDGLLVMCDDVALNFLKEGGGLKIQLIINLVRGVSIRLELPVILEPSESPAVPRLFGRSLHIHCRRLRVRQLRELEEIDIEP